MIMMFVKGCNLLCLAGIVVAVASYSCMGQSQSTDNDILGQHVEQVTINEPSVLLALKTIANDYRIPIGFEGKTKDNPLFDPPILVSIQYGTLRDVLDAVLAQDKRYRWNTIDGVVNVYPEANRDEVLMGLLDTRIREFVLPKNPTLLGARSAIVELPEIKSELEKARMTAPLIVVYTGHFRRLKDFSMRESNVTLREILNKIVAGSQAKFWVLNRWGKDNEELILNF
jgi:hypothetical protein